MRLVRFAAVWGAALGIVIAIVVLSLTEISPFAIVMLTLCPIFYLGSALYIKSKILLYIVTILGNGVFYGFSGGIIGMGFALLRRLTAHNRKA